MLHSLRMFRTGGGGVQLVLDALSKSKNSCSLPPLPLSSLSSNRLWNLESWFGELSVVGSEVEQQVIACRFSESVTC